MVISSLIESGIFGVCKTFLVKTMDIIVWPKAEPNIPPICLVVAEIAVAIITPPLAFGSFNLD